MLDRPLKYANMEIIVIGLGRIGLLAACCLAKSGHVVTGIEINPEKLERIKSGSSPFFEPGIAELLKALVPTGRLQFAQMLPDDITAEAVMVAVNSPALPNGSADLSQVQGAVSEIAQKINRPVTLIMKSTVPPGTGADLVNRFLQGKAVTYVSNPEFLRTGQSAEDWYKTSRVVIGASDKQAEKTMRRLYHDIQAPWVITDINSAEMIKYASNSFLATKVSFINEVANLCESVDANINDVVLGMGFDPRIGPAYLKPGIGYGGPCLTKDTSALEFFAVKNGYDFKLLRATIEVNALQRFRLVKKLKQLLISLKGKEIALLGLAFKPDSDDVNDAPAMDIARLLMEAGANLRVYDPMAMGNARRVLPPGAIFCPDIYTASAGACSVILATEWAEFIESDWARIHQAMVAPYIIVDGRNALAGDRLVDGGFKYLAPGRISDGDIL